MALLVMAFHALFTLPALPTNGMRLVAHRAVLIVVAADPPILAHGAFSCEFPVMEALYQRELINDVPDEIHQVIESTLLW